MASTDPSSSASKILPALGFGLAILALVLTLASGPGTRWGWWDFRFGLNLFRYAFYAGAAALLTCLVTAAILRRQAGGLSRFWLGLATSLLLTGNALA